jgi:hypothetical protein
MIYIKTIYLKEKERGVYEAKSEKVFTADFVSGFPYYYMVFLSIPYNQCGYGAYN